MVDLTKSYKSYGNTGSDPRDTRPEHMEDGFSPSLIPDKTAMEDPNKYHTTEGDSHVSHGKITSDGK